MSYYLSDTSHPSARAGVEEDLWLIPETHLQGGGWGFKMLDHKAAWHEVYLIKRKETKAKTAPKVTGN